MRDKGLAVTVIAIAVMLLLPALIGAVATSCSPALQVFEACQDAGMSATTDGRTTECSRDPTAVRP
jgi:hypothetical protein